ncbi:hypothetical protein Aduo_004250 [Ancylostoma duodenale]
MDGYVCSEVVKPKELMPSYKTIVASKMIPWKSKDGKVLYHYVVRDKGIPYEDAVKGCKEYGYKIPTIEDDEEVEQFGRVICSSRKPRREMLVQMPGSGSYIRFLLRKAVEMCA